MTLYTQQMNFIPNSSSIQLCWGSDLSSNESFHFTSESFLHGSANHQLIVTPTGLRPLLRDLICVKDYLNVSAMGVALEKEKAWHCPMVPDWVDVVTLNCTNASTCIEDCQLHVKGELDNYLIIAGSTAIVLSILVYLIRELVQVRALKQR